MGLGSTKINPRIMQRAQVALGMHVRIPLGQKLGQGRRAVQGKDNTLSRLHQPQCLVEARVEQLVEMVDIIGCMGSISISKWKLTDKTISTGTCTCPSVAGTTRNGDTHLS